MSQTCLANRIKIALAPAFVFLTLAAWNIPVAYAADASAILQSLSHERTQSTQPIEDSAGSMNHFYEALARTAAGQAGAMTRIAHFGDALVQKELLPGPVRILLQKKWGDGGHGFVFGSRPEPWYRPHDAYFKSSNSWISFNMTEESVRDRRFGLGGATATAFKAKAKVKYGTVKRGDIGTKISCFQILFPQEPTGGLIELSLDGKDFGTLNTRGPRYVDAYTEIVAPEGKHWLELRALGKNTRLHGLIMESSGPGVVYDALGVGESGVGTFSSMDIEHWQGQLRHRNPNLVIIGLGSNDITDTLNLSYYRLNMKTLVEHVKSALPNSSIMIMSPLDKSKRVGKEIITHEATPRMVAAQRRIAQETGTAFWSVFDAMGGEGSMAKWRDSSPKLGAGDLVLPTPKGGEVLGELFYNALMQGFAEYLDKNGLPNATPPLPSEDPLKKVEIQKLP